MAHLRLALLGPFLATLDGAPIQGLNSSHLRAMLAYLAVERGREHPREQVASLLWPNRPDREALSALRNALSNLRTALGDRRKRSPVLLVTRTTVQMNPAGDFWLDVAEFERLTQDAGRTGQDSDSRLLLLESCAALYRGPLLHGLSVTDSLTFHEWVLLKGEGYRRGVLYVLEELTLLRMARGETADAARWAREQLDVEPYREQAHRQLMAALALGGERAAALAHYQTYRRLLADELACEPDDETQALHAQIRDAGLSQPWPRPRTLRATPSPSRQAPPASGTRHAPQLVAAQEQGPARPRSLPDPALNGQGAPMEKQPNSRMCFVCGIENPIGLHLHFYTDGQGRCTARFRPKSEHQSYPGQLHGGLISTLLDETMGRVLTLHGVWAVTGRLEVTYRKPVPLDQDLTIVGELTRDRAVAYEARGQILLPDGTVLVEGTGLYFRIPEERVKEGRSKLDFWEVVPE